MKSKTAAKKSGTKVLKVDYLPRVEGEGAMFIRVRNGEVSDVKLNIFEPPRFFEAFMRGRSFREAPDITARICGICPVAYQMSSVHAMEDACGITVGGQLRALRRLMYCGEWIESHALHAYMLHLPDFLGYPDVIRLAKDHPDPVKKALELKKLGNELVTFLAGREIHPINVRVGGFYSVPSKKHLRAFGERLKPALELAIETVRLTSKLKYPDFERNYEYVALRHPDEYPYNEGRLVSSKGLDVAVREYEEHFIEEHMEHSNALHGLLKMRGAFHVGPLARINLNWDKLTPVALGAAKEIGFKPPCNNPFKSIIARAVETVFAVEEALRIIEAYEEPDRPYVDVVPRTGIGCGCTEAPRGILYHRYRIDERGNILDSRIVPPTAQNQRTIEEDLMDYVPKFMHQPEDKLVAQCEQAIRNYDPCISCATHFLKLKVTRE